VNSTQFSPNRRRIILAAGRRVYILGRYTGQTILDSLETHAKAVTSVTFAPNSSYTLSGSHDGTICKWTPMSDHEYPNPLIKHSAPILSFEISPDGTRLALSLETSSVCVHATHDGQQLFNLIQPEAKQIYFVIFTHDGTQLVCGSDNKTISTWDSQTGEAI
ncbi:WD40-repeat-containing domain protein, partial [Rhizoctonia solani]